LRRACDVIQDWSEFGRQVVKRLIESRTETFSPAERQSIERATAPDVVYAELSSSLHEHWKARANTASGVANGRRSSRKRMRVLSIFVRHGTAKYPGAEEELAELFSRQLPGIDRDVVVVDTALKPGGGDSSRAGVIGGDNSVREFSGFDTGLAHVGDALHDYDLVNLTTSAFRELYRDYLERFRPSVLSAIVGRSVCLGHIDCYNEPIQLIGSTSQHWIRTSCMFLSPALLGSLGSVVSSGDRDRWFSGDPSKPFRADAPLSSSYQTLIIDWLLGKDIGQGVTWHSRISLDHRSLPEFEQKALSILNEHLLSVRVAAAGGYTIDVTWLSAMLDRGHTPVEWNTPWWQQLANRDRDAIRARP
jgi:hypothetical protein